MFEREKLKDFTTNKGDLRVVTLKKGDDLRGWTIPEDCNGLFLTTNPTNYWKEHFLSYEMWRLSRGWARFSGDFLDVLQFQKIPIILGDVSYIFDLEGSKNLLEVMKLNKRYAAMGGSQITGLGYAGGLLALLSFAGRLNRRELLTAFALAGLSIEGGGLLNERKMETDTLDDLNERMQHLSDLNGRFPGIKLGGNIIEFPPSYRLLDPIRDAVNAQKVEDFMAKLRRERGGKSRFMVVLDGRSQNFETMVRTSQKKRLDYLGKYLGWLGVDIQELIDPTSLTGSMLLRNLDVKKAAASLSDVTYQREIIFHPSLVMTFPNS